MKTLSNMLLFCVVAALLSGCPSIERGEVPVTGEIVPAPWGVGLLDCDNNPKECE